MKTAGGQPITQCSCMIVVHNSLKAMREKIKATGWDKVSDIHDSGFGADLFVVEDLNGLRLEFLEWKNNKDSE